MTSIGDQADHVKLNEDVACGVSSEQSGGGGSPFGFCVLTVLVDKGVLVSESPRAPLRLTFPAATASRWLPGIVPEKEP